jgi:uncharacterized protein (DUF1786 family)
MTRLLAVAETVPNDLPLLLMDTAPAAIVGALEDQTVREAQRPLVANVGNFHCLAFRLANGRVAGLFEHHTGELTPSRLRGYVEQLADGTISNEVVFADKGHGSLMLDPWAQPPDLVAATGPRRTLLVESGLRPYLAVPRGDMMLAGNLGLLRSYAAHDERARAAIEDRLGAPSSAVNASS